MKSIRTVILAALMGAAMPAFAAESLKATVNGMVCAFCAQGIEAKLSKLPQAQNVYVNLAHKVVAVQIKDGMKLSPDVVRQVVKDAGYDVAAIEAVSMTTAQIKAEVTRK